MYTYSSVCQPINRDHSVIIENYIERNAIATMLLFIRIEEDLQKKVM